MHGQPKALFAQIRGSGFENTAPYYLTLCMVLEHNKRVSYPTFKVEILRRRSSAEQPQKLQKHAPSSTALLSRELLDVLIIYFSLNVFK